MTDNLRLYHELVPVFASRGIVLLGLRPGEPIPPSVLAILDGPSNDERTVPIREDAEATLLAVAQRLDDRPTARPAYREVIFGIDPGQTIGLAVLADGAALMVAQAQDADSAAKRLAAWRTGLEALAWRVHIGDGHPESGEPVRNAVQLALPDATVHWIHEGRTTPASPITDSRHTDAAIHIALRRA